MNKLILLVALAFSATAFGQIKIVRHDDLATAVNGTTVEFTGNPADFEVQAYLNFINNTGSSNDFRITRKRFLITPAGAIEQLCDNVQCYNVTDTEMYTTPTTVTLAAGDTSILKPQYRPQGESFCALSRYYVVNNFGVVYDSVDVKINVGGLDCTGTASIEEDVNPELSVYPNPASNVLNISLLNSDNGKIVIFDALGKEVLRKTIVNNSTLDVSDLRNGVYFYHLIDSKGVSTEAKRLIVKK